MVEPIEAQHNIELPIVAEPVNVEAKSITDLTTVAKSNTDLPIGLELTWDQALFYKYSLTQTLIRSLSTNSQVYI